MENSQQHAKIDTQTHTQNYTYTLATFMSRNTWEFFTSRRRRQPQEEAEEQEKKEQKEAEAEAEIIFLPFYKLTHQKP